MSGDHLPSGVRTVQADGERLGALLRVVGELGEDPVRVLVTADRTELPEELACHPADAAGSAASTHTRLSEWRKRSRAVFFPTDLESFGYPLAEARVNGQPVIACDTEQNREIQAAPCAVTSRTTPARCGMPWDSR